MAHVILVVTCILLDTFARMQITLNIFMGRSLVNATLFTRLNNQKHIFKFVTVRFSLIEFCVK